MQDSAIVIRGLCKSFKSGALVNDHIDLDVARGSAMSILGPNGAGKTTMIRQITGELSPTAGSISILGFDVLKQTIQAKGAMGVVPQDAQVFPTLKPADQMRTFGQLHGLSARQSEQRAEELLTELGLEPHRDKLNKYLSGGLQRKVLIGTALMAKPPVLVLDEPTTGLDPHSRRDVWAMLRSLRREGTTLLITTHYMDEAEALSDRVTVLGAGRILAQGTIDELRDLCSNRFKATYVEDGESQTIYGQAQAELLEELDRREVDEFSLTRTSLEDLYLELTGS